MEQHRPRSVLIAALAAIICMLQPIASSAASITVSGITFSDELGGFVLKGVTGQGSLDDPFVLKERLTDLNGGTLLFRVSSGFGNQIGSPHSIGFAMVKIVENGTGVPWTSFEIELQSKLGVPSGYDDGLSFGQGSSAGKPFTATGFGQVTLLDEPYDRIELDQGKIETGASATFRFVVSETMPLQQAYLAQRPRRPVARAIPVRTSVRVGSLLGTDYHGSPPG